MLSQLAENISDMNQSDLENQNIQNSSSRNISIVKRRLFSLHKTMKIIILLLICILVSLESFDIITNHIKK